MKPWQKYFRLEWHTTHDLCNTGAPLNQQVSCEHGITANGEAINVLTSEKDVKTWRSIKVMHATYLIIALKKIQVWTVEHCTGVADVLGSNLPDVHLHV